MQDQFTTLARHGLAEFKVKGSRFIGEAYPVAAVEAAQQQLEAIRRREHAATHHCYAWRIGRGSALMVKFSDDGEPSGTAGRPILDTLEGSDITNALVIVTRYFGGTKLGTGGLSRAYGDTAAAAVRAAGTVRRYDMVSVRFTVDLPQYGAVRQVCERLGGDIREAHFDQSARIVVAIRAGRRDDLVRAFLDATHGRGRSEDVGA